MKRTYWLALIAAMLMVSGDVYAAPKKGAAPKSRQEAIVQVKEALAKLEKMSDEEWAAQAKKRAERRAKQRQGKGGGKAKKAN